MLTTEHPDYTSDGLYVADSYEVFAGTHLKHAGNDDYYGTPFYLEDFQRDHIWRPIFACGEFDESGKFTRTYRRGIIGLPRNYGKTELMAAIVITVATMETVYNGQYGIIASTKEQAANCFNKIKSMIYQDDELTALWDVQQKRAINRETGAEIVVYPYSEAALQSWHLNVAILDEMHVYKDGRVYEAVISGQKSIPNALTLCITTAAKDQNTYLYKLLQREVEERDPSTYIWWCGADDGDDPHSEETWEKVLYPSWITLDDIRDQHRSLPLASFMRYVLNVFVPLDLEAERAFKPEEVDACITDEPFDWDMRLMLAMDGAVSGDCFAQVYCGIDDRDVFHLLPIIFQPGENSDDRGRYDQVAIADSILDTYMTRDLIRITADPAYVQTIIQLLDNRHRIAVESFSQRTWIGMANASQLLGRLVEDGRVRIHGEHAGRLAEHMKNSTKNTGAADDGTWRLGKSKRRKNDGAIAAAMAVAVAESDSIESGGRTPMILYI